MWHRSPTSIIMFRKNTGRSVFLLLMNGLHKLSTHFCSLLYGKKPHISCKKHGYNANPCWSKQGRAPVVMQIWIREMQTKKTPFLARIIFACRLKAIPIKFYIKRNMGKITTLIQKNVSKIYTFRGLCWLLTFWLFMPVA